MPDFLKVVDEASKLDEDKQEKFFNDHFKKLHEKYKDELELHELWWEYLKRSDKYEKVCEWFRNAKKKSSYIKYYQKALDGLDKIDEHTIFFAHIMDLYSLKPPISLSQYLKNILDPFRKGKINIEENFFNWAIREGFPYENEMLINYFVFSDVIDKPYSSAKFVFLLQIKEEALNKSVLKLDEMTDQIFDWVKRIAVEELKRDPNIDEFRNFFNNYLKHNVLHLYVCIETSDIKIMNQVRYIFPQIKQLLEERKSHPLYVALEKQNFFEGNQFEFPGKKVPIEKLSAYLKVYDLKKQGQKTNREIGEIIFPKIKYDNETNRKYIARHRKHAEQIIKNVEKGFFPGKLKTSN